MCCIMKMNPISSILTPATCESHLVTITKCILKHMFLEMCLKQMNVFLVTINKKKWLFFISKQILAFKQSGGMCSL